VCRSVDEEKKNLVKGVKKIKVVFLPLLTVVLAF
jgi:hypothetical protein